MSTEQRDPIRVAAQFLAHHGTPGIGQQLLTEHAADTTGHCRAYHRSSGASPVWPCNLWLIGTHVQQLTAPGPTAMTHPPGPRPGRGHRRPTRLREP